jgi:hypothetical protein
VFTEYVPAARSIARSLLVGANPRDDLSVAWAATLVSRGRGLHVSQQ